MPFKENKYIKTAVSIIIFFIAGTASSQGIFGDHWMEEIVTHDNQHIIVSRYQKYGGPHHFGEEQPIHDQAINFRLPSNNEEVTWEDSASRLGYANSILLSLDIVQGATYLVVTPKTCDVWTLLGKPNPPYLLFKLSGKSWETIPVAQLPEEIKRANFLVDRTPRNDLLKHGVLSNSNIEIANRYTDQNYLIDIKKDKIDYACAYI